VAPERLEELICEALLKCKTALNKKATSAREPGSVAHKAIEQA
jgi:hypothetical protein